MAKAIDWKARAEAAERVVRALAASEPPLVRHSTQGGSYREYLCCHADDYDNPAPLWGQESSGGGRDTLEHTPACPWRMARELAAAATESPQDAPEGG